MNPDCYGSGSEITRWVKNVSKLGGGQTRVMLSFWPDVKSDAEAHAALAAEGCIAGSVVPGGHIQNGDIDPTSQKCRDFIWSKYVMPNYVEHGIMDFWLDEVRAAARAVVTMFHRQILNKPAFPVRCLCFEKLPPCGQDDMHSLAPMLNSTGGTEGELTRAPSAAYGRELHDHCQLILPPAPGVSNAGGSSPLLALVPAVSWA